MTDEKKLDEDRKSQLEHRLYKRYEVIYDEGEEAVSSWIDENQVTRSEAEQIADSNGNFLEQRLSTMLDRLIEEEGAIFVDDVLEEVKIFQVNKSLQSQSPHVETLPSDFKIAKLLQVVVTSIIFPSK